MQRLFTSLWYQADSWDRERFVIVKAEVHEKGTNRRAIVTNRPGAMLLSAATYEEYTQRGESENRNKELKRGVKADRLSDHRFMANFFRLYLHVTALNLLVRLRRVVTHNPSPESLGIHEDVPPEALSGKHRKGFFNRRRQADPLGEGDPDTCRLRFIKVAAEVIVSSRRVVVKFSSSWPHLPHLIDVTSQVLASSSPDRKDFTDRKTCRCGHGEQSKTQPGEGEILSRVCLPTSQDKLDVIPSKPVPTKPPA